MAAVGKQRISVLNCGYSLVAYSENLASCGLFADSRGPEQRHFCQRLLPARLVCPVSQRTKVRTPVPDVASNLEAAGPTAETPRGAAYLWWMAILSRVDYLPALAAMVWDSTAWGDFSEVADTIDGCQPPMTSSRVNSIAAIDLSARRCRPASHANGRRRSVRLAP